jgi:hypothetical protein
MVVRCQNNVMLSGFLLQRHGASSGFGWKRHRSLWGIAANILHRQMLTADKGWSSSLGFDGRPKIPHHKNIRRNKIDSKHKDFFPLTRDKCVFYSKTINNLEPGHLENNTVAIFL